MKRSFLLISFVAATTLGCARPQAPVVPTPPPQVIFCYPIEKDVTGYEDFTGRTVALKLVDIRSRVTGQLVKQHFKDGDFVKEGDPLFDIDPTTYSAEYERAIAVEVQAEAKVERLETDLIRQIGAGIRFDLGIFLARDVRARYLDKLKSISRQEYDTVMSDRTEAAAALGVARRQVIAAKNYVDYTHIRSPVTGLSSKRAFDPGNLVKADDTLLTNIVALDPIYAEFDIDDRTVLRVRRLIEAGTVQSARAVKTEVGVGLPDEDGFSMTGTITFVDNQLNPGTGTIRVRAEVANPKRLLSPGMFLRVRLPIGMPKKEILVPEIAIGTDQGLKYVYVVNADNEVVKCRVDLGLPVEFGTPKQTYRVVHPVATEPGAPGIAGLKTTDRVIVKGLQRVREKAKVTPMPDGDAKLGATSTAPKG